jgi:DNA polymerase-3 subunit gamma/tau
MLDELNSLLARVALFQSIGGPYDDEDLIPVETLAALASSMSPEDLQLYYHIGLLGRRDLPLASDQPAGFAMTLLRMLAFRLDAGSGAVASAMARRARPHGRRGMAAPAGWQAPPGAQRLAGGPT